MNIQSPEKRAYKSDGSLYVHSIFYTIQGEGPYSGMPAIFIRLAGCNLQCPLCDTIYTGPDVVQRTYSEICLDVKRLKPHKFVPLIVITGGEPFRQNVSLLCSALQAAGHIVQIETNGSLPPPGLHGVTVVVSPKTPVINSEILHYAKAFKYVLAYNNVDPDDGLPINVLGLVNPKRVARPPVGFKGTIYVQPMDAGNDLDNRCNLDSAIESCMKFGYTLQLQVHKLIGLE